MFYFGRWCWCFVFEWINTNVIRLIVHSALMYLCGTELKIPIKIVVWFYMCIYSIRIGYGRVFDWQQISNYVELCGAKEGLFNAKIMITLAISEQCASRQSAKQKITYTHSQRSHSANCLTVLLHVYSFWNNQLVWMLQSYGCACSMGICSTSYNLWDRYR